MTDDPDLRDLQGGLASLSDRNYGEEGIPMILVLENRSSLVPGADPTAGHLGRLLREGAKASGAHGREHDAAGPARLIEWIADRTFGPSALARAVNEAKND